MLRDKTHLLCLTLLLALSASAYGQTNAPQAAPAAGEPGLAPILHYISGAWDTLTRSMTQCASVTDPKLKTAGVVYLPADFPAPPALEALSRQCNISLQHLPKVLHRLGEIDPRTIQPQGLLYLDHPYVVPGGRFNEMYGWDSYFIIRGLLRAGRVDLARDMVENFFFEIEHYGGVLNANRTYYLSRSQPPFLTSMILGVYEADKAAGKNDHAWLERAYQDASRDYQLWSHEPHLAGTTGLARYFDFGAGPAPEELRDDAGYYRTVVGYYLLHPSAAAGHLMAETTSNPDAGPVFALEVCSGEQFTGQESAGCTKARDLQLTPEYYKADRSMRESGFDPSFRFGPYAGDTQYYAPVCLNSLLYKTEKDMEQIATLLGKAAEARQWGERAQLRRAAINKYFWDPRSGMFFDYNFKTNTRSSYHYITTFYPLWAGLATPQQARALQRNLHIFEHPGGLAMSDQQTGVQWDLPYGWAPTQLVAIEGLRRYGFNDDANRLSYKFLSMVDENFLRNGTIREKYNVVTRSDETSVAVGYQSNVIGFGWTNAAFLALLHELPQEWVQRLQRLPAPAAAAAP
ncbi:MAG TPA: trehalase family glycosidase [Terriglobales bacterium]|nr:trehalase family glycosidase [Terriglobales bacterium]